MNHITFLWWRWWTLRSASCPIEHMDAMDVLISICY
jgi:hypothetical protein